MLRLAGLALTLALLLPAARPQNDLKPQNEMFLKYKAVETYEVRPGILMMPRYSTDGSVCEVGLEPRHYSPDLVNLALGMSRKDIDEIVDEIAPVSERGPKSELFAGRDMDFFDGISMTTLIEYENVSIQIYSPISATPKRFGVVAENVAATIKWNKRPCQ